MPGTNYWGSEHKDGGERELIETLPAEDNQEEMIDKLLLRTAIESLPERDRKIIVLRYFRDMTQSEVAEKIGVSQVQVSRIESRIIKEFREKLTGWKIQNPTRDGVGFFREYRKTLENRSREIFRREKKAGKNLHRLKKPAKRRDSQAYSLSCWKWFA